MMIFPLYVSRHLRFRLVTLATNHLTAMKRGTAPMAGYAVTDR